MTQFFNNYPVNLSTTYSHLPQTAQLEHFADLLQQLFAAQQVIILFHRAGLYFYVSSAQGQINPEDELIAAAIANHQFDNNSIFHGLDHFAKISLSKNETNDEGIQGIVAFKLSSSQVTAEQEAALSWLVECIESYLSQHPFIGSSQIKPQLIIENAELIKDVTLISDSHGIHVLQQRTPAMIQLTSAELSEFLGLSLHDWLLQQILSPNLSSEIKVHCKKNEGLTLNLNYWQTGPESWVLQTADISLSHQLRMSRHQQSFLQSLFSSGIAAMIGINEHQQVVYANSQARQLLLIAQNEDRLKAPIDLGYLQFFDPDHSNQGQIQPFLTDNQTANPTLHFNRLVQYPSGEEKVLSLWMVEHYDIQTPEIRSYCLLQDMTAQHQLQHALQAMQEHIDNLLQFSPAAIYQAFSNLSDGFMYISPNIEKLCGFTQSEVMNDPTFWPRHVHPDDLTLVFNANLTEDKSLEYRLFCLNKGRYIWVKDIRNTSQEDENSQIVFGALLDIDARKQAELEQIRLSHELESKKIELSQSLDSMVDAVVTLDEHAVLLTCNPATSKLFGYDVSELISTKFADLLLEPTAFIDFFNAFIEKTAHLSDPKALEFSGRTKKEQVIYFSCSLAELPVMVGKKRRFVVCLHDLTESKQQQEQLIQAGKLSALGTLTSGIAHDFNNILGIIRGYAEMLSVRSEPQIANYASNIMKAADRGAAMTKNLLDFSSNKSRDLIKIDINQLIVDMKDLFKEALTKRITLNIELSSETLSVEIEKGGLENALLNLVINARHAIKDMGEISICSELINLPQLLAKSLDLPPGNYCCVRVKDTGSGMTEEVLQKLFEPFFTTKGAQGTGLGLAQVFGFCRRCKGAIRVVSKLGEGTEFFLYFPRVATTLGHAPAAIQPTKVAVTPRFQQTKLTESRAKVILLVDDEEDLLDVNSMILGTSGYEVVTATNIKDAILLLEQRTFDLVISDIVMPNGSGLQLATHVCLNYPDLPIQLISGFADESMIEDESSRQYFEKRLQKPVSTSLLLSTVDQLLKKTDISEGI